MQPAANARNAATATASALAGGRDSPNVTALVRDRLLVTLLVVAVVPACGWRAHVRSTPPVVGETREAFLRSGFVSVRVELPATPPGPKPVVISFLDERDAFLAAGLGVVTYRVDWEQVKAAAPPPPPPGATTVGVWLLASPTPRTIGQGYLRLIAATANIAGSVLDYLTTLPGVDPHRIGIAGSSTYGFVALEAAADPRIAAAAVIAACGDYHAFLERSTLAMNGAPLDLDRGYERDLVRQEAVRHPEWLTHAAVLMVNGTSDVAVPEACAENTARVFRAAYADAGAADRFRFVLVEGAGHNDLAARARAESLAWFSRWLARTDARTDG